MMVDDDPTSLAIGRALLETDYELTMARSGVQALGFLKTQALPDLILMDMMMPGLGGMEVLKTLKSSQDLHEIPVIFLTGTSQIGEELESYAIGASDFLQKPVNPEMLKIKIKQQIYYLSLKRENIKLKNAIYQIKAQLNNLNLPEADTQQIL